MGPPKSRGGSPLWVAFYLLARFGFGLMAYPRSVFIIDGVILILLMGGVRLSRRIWREISGLRGDEPVLIYGAGDVGETLVWEMRRDPKHAREPIGFVDDDPMKIGERIHGIPVFWTSADLPAIMA